jgi:hypothetical protein
MGHRLAYWVCCVSRECMGQGKIIGTEVIWVMIAWLDVIERNELWRGYCMAVLPAYMQPITHHKYCQYMCNSLYSSIFCAMISQAYIMLMCLHDVYSTKRFTNTQWRLMWLSRISSFPTASFIHVFIRFCLCSAGSMRKGGDEECIIQCLYAQSVPYVLRVCFTVTVMWKSW